VAQALLNLKAQCRSFADEKKYTFNGAAFSSKSIKSLPPNYTFLNSYQLNYKLCLILMGNSDKKIRYKVILSWISYV
jgi:hypothetical protein